MPSTRSRTLAASTPLPASESSAAMGILMSAVVAGSKDWIPGATVSIAIVPETLPLSATAGPLAGNQAPVTR